MVGQAVGATGESPKDDRQSRVPRGTVPPKMPVATKSSFFSRLLLRIPICISPMAQVSLIPHRALSARGGLQHANAMAL
jgi:hypothetical protein